MMYLGQEYEQRSHYRKSRYGTLHVYLRKKTVCIFQCDSCGGTFKRDKGDIDPKRLNNNYYHVCANCDAKRFAQQKGVEARKIWDLPVSSMKTIDSFKQEDSADQSQPNQQSSKDS